jgi:Flp pilus assembly protein TadG
MSSPKRPSPRVSRLRPSRGQSLVEFALILPVFLAVLGGILDFGMMLNSRLTLINAIREGARWAAVQGDVTTIPLATGGGLKDQNGLIGSNIRGLSWANLTTAPGSISITCNLAAGGTNNCDFGTDATKPNAVRGDSILISVTYPHRSVYASLLGQTINLGTQVQMVLEVPTP